MALELLDERCPLAYLRPMAKRLILSLLALLTGLFAQIGPAQANPCAAGASEIGVMIGDCAEAAPRAARAAVRPLLRLGIKAPLRLIAIGTAVAPATRIGIDRSLQ